MITLKQRIKKSKKLNNTEKEFLLEAYDRSPFSYSYSLLDVFLWLDQPEGHDFWQDAHYALEEVLESEEL